MNKAVKKFVIFAEGAIFLLLAVLLSVINVVNFAMASEDADMLTSRLASREGVFRSDKPEGERQPFFREKDAFRLNRFDKMGPDSPEMDFSLRYFTYSFDKDGNAEAVVFKMSAVSEQEAEEWARSLKNASATGWTRVNYRYRVYESNKQTYVTVIDQGRELVPSYRILIISVSGGVVLLVLSMLMLLLTAGRIFKPIEESDRKQKQFIANVKNEFRVPLTIINANTELIEREHGPGESTRVINKQVRRMTATVKELSSLAVFEEADQSVTKVNLSDLMNSVLDSRAEAFEQKSVRMTAEVAPDVMIEGDSSRLRKMIEELAENTLKYAQSEAHFTLSREKKRIRIRQENDTTLANGAVDQIFDRFTVLENAEASGSIGMGLSYVKATVLAHNGRVSAKVSDGRFILQIDL